VYGSGEAGFASLAAIDDAAWNLFQTGILAYIVISVAFLLIATMFSQWIAGAFNRAAALWATAALTGLAVALTAVLKHYQPHYVVAVSAMLPFALSPALGHHRIRWLAAGITAIGLFVTSSLTPKFFGELSSVGFLAAKDEAVIAAMPLQSGEARLWTYRAPTRSFAEGFVVGLSGISRLDKDLQDPRRQEFSSFSRVNRPYRYVVLDRHYYPDLESVRHASGSLEPTQGFMVRLEKSDRLHLLETMIVVERGTP
jgi:hypothetical protein